MASKIDLNEVANVRNLPESETELLRELLKVWSAKLARNQLRTQYYDQKNTIKNLGIAIPEDFAMVDSVIGWPAKAVEALRDRHNFEGWVMDGGDTTRLTEIMEANSFETMYWQAVSSELVHSCAFATVTRGGDGEPSVVVNFHSAETAAAIWDYRNKRIKAGVTVEDVQYFKGRGGNRPVWVNLYTDDAVYEVRRDKDAKGNYGNTWSAERKPHPMGRPLIEPLCNEPSLGRPFGKSRITRAVMSITDSAVRTSLRAEIGAEFYTTPQKWVMGATEDDLDKPKWAAYIGSWFMAGKDEDGEKPTVGQFSQGTMQPHLDMLRMQAAQFSGETSVPISSLGVIHDNPSSAEAIYAAKEDLIVKANNLAKTNGQSLRNIALMALAIDRDTTIEGLSPEERSVSARFKNPALVSLVSQSDAVVKIASCITGFGDSRVALELLGLDESQINRIETEKKMAMAMGSVTEALASLGDVTQDG